jgi:hypothetical protein
MVAAPHLVISDSEFAGSIGIARADITPPAGIYARCWGSSTHDIATGVHKPLLATCIIFAETVGGNALALLALDLSWWSSKQDELDLRSAILAGSGLAEHELMMHPSHTHSAPRTAMEFIDRPGGHLIPQYREQIKKTSVGLILEARNNLRAATVTWRSGRCDLAYNRDLRSPDDGRILCGINPKEDADHTLLVGRAVGEDGRVLCTFVNYACHPISLGGGNTLVSPDYVGAMREIVEAATESAPCVFLHGASGNQTPRRSFESDTAIADQNGREIGYSVLSVLSSMFRPQTLLKFCGVEESGTPLAVWREQRIQPPALLRSRRETVRLTIAEIPSREALKAAIAAATEAYMVERLNRRLLQRESVGDGTEGDFSFFVWQLGDSFIVGTPAEMHSGFQLELRRRFPDRSIAVLNIVNGYASYLPPRADYAVGPYPTRVAVYAMGSMEIVLAAADRVIRDMLIR